MPVGSKGPIQVGVSSSYCTCVSLWRVPLMKVVRADDVAAREGGDDFLAADSVLGGENGSFIEVAAQQAK